MNHTGTQPIETKRLYLRRYTQEDAQAMFAGWAQDPEVARYMRWSPHKDLAETQGIVAQWVTAYENPGNYNWAVTLKDTGALIGGIGVFPTAEGHKAPTWEPGYNFARAYWGKGYATEALQAVVDYFTSSTGTKKMACCHAVANPASGRVMQKVGFVYSHDGVYHRHDGTPVPCKFYTLDTE